jgi:hypothetical protein
MIEQIPNSDKVWVSFNDWTPDMMALASLLNRKPDRPGEQRPRSHEIGIDELSKLPMGRFAIDALWGVADELTYCPDYDEILALGRTLICAYAELEVLCEKRRRQKVYLQDRERANARKKTPPLVQRTSGAVGFVRRRN